MTRRLPALILLVFGLSAGEAGAAAPFSFWDASLLPEAEGQAEAQAFVASAFPPGLPLAAAERRAEAAQMRCRPVRDGGLACLWSTPEGAEGGLIGEDAWTLRLTPGPGGVLAGAELSRSFIGAGPPNPR